MVEQTLTHTHNNGRSYVTKQANATRPIDTLSPLYYRENASPSAHNMLTGRGINTNDTEVTQQHRLVLSIVYLCASTRARRLFAMCECVLPE